MSLEHLRVLSLIKMLEIIQHPHWQEDSQISSGIFTQSNIMQMRRKMTLYYTNNINLINENLSEKLTYTHTEIVFIFL